MRLSSLLVNIARFIFPFMLMFGLYVILYGDVSPGGGFQGGAILASAYITAYIARGERIFEMGSLVLLEKLLYVLIVALALVSVFTKGEAFTSFIPPLEPLNVRRLFLIAMNMLIGFKVALGLTSLFSAFVEQESVDD
ncbi:hypothetical protein EAL2_c20720 [Peptoclostridium acidaminophilum DSM 3953]|uniref:Na+/H+ antiporter MnhB subunit-related protein domain-containing protein n=1 Tax=Peptoclostridium acidaminophilum DSM 3953 TaxID=1286171 RepID=W8THN8_PEPAC|nr:MnhB domain-containing protein [Peptoclostridium acidaminophilum]AHM57353.1 hypothetical protein EAL2_c20720 [Peptoclostridium acidaminophilum DSM 3953]